MASALDNVQMIAGGKTEDHAGIFNYIEETAQLSVKAVKTLGRLQFY